MGVVTFHVFSQYRNHTHLLNNFLFILALQTYFGMDVSAVEDPVQRRALETMIKTYGQTPRQLFHTSHISRAGPKLIIEGELPAAMGLLVQLAFRESRDQNKDIVHPVRLNPHLPLSHLLFTCNR